MKMHSLALAAVAVVAMGSAHADTYSFSGTVALTDGTFNRPSSLTALATGANGSAVHYDVAALLGVSAGSYDFRMTSGNTFDTFLLLYAGVFNPASPLTNLVALNDDFGGSVAAGSGFTYTLSPSVFYTVVSTAYSNTGVGNYVTSVTPAVPEPSTYVMMALGLAAMGGLVLRRSRD